MRCRDHAVGQRPVKLVNTSAKIDQPCQARYASSSYQSTALETSYNLHLLASIRSVGVWSYGVDK